VEGRPDPRHCDHDSMHDNVLYVDIIIEHVIQLIINLQGTHHIVTVMYGDDRFAMGCGPSFTVLVTCWYVSSAQCLTSFLSSAQ
jgi:hypothetical protein